MYEDSDSSSIHSKSSITNSKPTNNLKMIKEEDESDLQSRHSDSIRMPPKQPSIKMEFPQEDLKKDMTR